MAGVEVVRHTLPLSRVRGYLPPHNTSRARTRNTSRACTSVTAVGHGFDDNRNICAGSEACTTC